MPSDDRRGLAPAAGVSMLPRLTSLRLFGALAVAWFHLGVWEVLPAPAAAYDLGYVGVAFFFILSGFVLAWGTKPGLPARTFWRRRFARVWPSHFVVLLVSTVVPVVSVARDWPAAIANVFLVQAWFVFDARIVFGMNGPSWSLSCEAFFYAMFPVTVLVLRRLPGRARWGLAGVALLCSVAATLVLGHGAFPLPIVRYSEFVLGVVAGLAVREGWRPWIPAWLAAAVTAASLVVSHWLPDPMPDTAMAPAFLLVLLCAAGRDLADRPGWLCSRWLVFAGEASFAFYLVHELVIVNLRTRLTGSTVLDIAVILTVAIAAAVALHLGVERPCNSILRGRSSSVALRVPPAHLHEPHELAMPGPEETAHTGGPDEDGEPPRRPVAPPV